MGGGVGLEVALGAVVGEMVERLTVEAGSGIPIVNGDMSILDATEATPAPDLVVLPTW